MDWMTMDRLGELADALGVDPASLYGMLTESASPLS